MTDFKEIYKGKKVLVTGHTGFKGSWLSVWLTMLGAEVIGYSQEPPSDPNMFEAINLEDRVTHVKGDVRHEDRLTSVFESIKPDIVFHLAAQPIVRRSYKEPKRTYQTNIMGTVNLLEAVRATDSVRACVIVTSDKCYEDKEWVYGYRETDPMGGYDPYSSSKGCAELVTAAYRKSYSLPISSVRAGNVIGGGDWGEDRLIPDCVRALSQQKPIQVRYPNAMRSWQYVLDVLHGYLLLGGLMHEEGDNVSGSWNFGPNDESVITVEELVRHIIEYWGKGAYIANSGTQPHEATLLKLDTSKARALLGWKPVYRLDQAIGRAASWYKGYYKGMRGTELYEYTVGQIELYEANMEAEE
jgi:CDP-glucose 4,6-dehydratase